MRHRLLPVAILVLLALPAAFAQTHHVGTLNTTTGPANVVTDPVRWTVTSTPAVSLQASASKAAGGTTVRHVADCVTFSAGATTAPALTKLNINLRDGATGAGTIKKSWTVVIPAATGTNVPPFGLCDLGIVGSQNTAMTLEFSSLLANVFQDVTLVGHSLAE